MSVTVVWNDIVMRCLLRTRKGFHGCRARRLGRDPGRESWTLSVILIRVLGMYQWFILGGCLRISLVYRVFQPVGVGASSACVCDCKRRTRESCSESENGSLSRSGMDKVGFGSGIRWFMVS